MGFRDRYNDGYGMGYIDAKRHYNNISTVGSGGGSEYYPPGMISFLSIILYFAGYYVFYQMLASTESSPLWMIIAPFWPLLLVLYILLIIFDSILDVLFGINITLFGRRL